MGKSKTERIDRLEKMLQGSNGEMHTYEPYKGVFADLEEHHSRLKAVEHDVPELIRTVERLVERVGALERDAAEVAARDITLTTEKFPFIASTADVEDVPGAGEVTSETHLWSLEERNVNVLQRMVKEALAQRDEARARIKELEEERELLRDKIDRLETEAIDRDRTYKASLLSKNTVGGEDVSFWHRRYWDLDQRIVRFRNGYTSFGSPERHELDRILDQADRSLSVEEEE